MSVSHTTGSQELTVSDAPAPQGQHSSGDLALLTEIIVEITGLPGDAVVPEADLIEDLYIDSVAKIELVVACQNRTGVEIPDEDIGDLRTVASVLEYVATHRTAQ